MAETKRVTTEQVVGCVRVPVSSALVVFAVARSSICVSVGRSIRPESSSSVSVCGRSSTASASLSRWSSLVPT